MLDGFFLSQAEPAQLLEGYNDPWLLALSIFIALVSASVALRLAAIAQASQGMARQVALLSGSLVLGCGIWAMHFVGMLAFDLYVPVHYDLGLTLVSMVPGLLASWIALGVLSHSKINSQALLTGGLCVGIGIGAMHYSGMASMQMAPLLRYDPAWFAASLLVAIALSILALRTHFAQWDSSRPQWVTQLAPALLMSAAISGTHYTAMAATRFVGTPDMIAGPETAELRTLAMTVALAAFAIMGLIALLIGLLRYRALWHRVESNEQRLQSMVDMAVDGIVTIDRHGCIQAYNPAAEAIFGWTAAETLGRNVSMLMPSPLAEQHDGYIERYHRTGEARMMGSGREVLGLHRNGRHLPLKMSLKKVDTPDALLFVGFVTDLSERKKTEARLRIAASVVEHSYEGILVLDAHYQVVDMNPAYLRMSALTQAHCKGRALEDLYPPDAFSPDFDTVRRTVAKTTHWQGELETLGTNGVKVVHRMSISAVLDDHQRPQHYIAVVTDITQEKLHERKLEKIALYDALTGLPNRRLLNDRLAQGIHAATRQQTMLAILYIDLDGFKQVNDQMGHADGDLLLCEVGRRIRAELRGEDTAARVGGDEIVLLMGDWNTGQQTETTIERLLQVICHPVELPRGTVRVTASIGVSIFPLDAQTPDQLLARADTAMYEAKQRGKNQFRRCNTPATHAAASDSPPAQASHSLARSAMGAHSTQNDGTSTLPSPAIDL